MIGNVLRCLFQIMYSVLTSVMYLLVLFAISMLSTHTGRPVGYNVQRVVCMCAIGCGGGEADTDG